MRPRALDSVVDRRLRGRGRGSGARTCSTFLLGLGGVRWFDADQAHHTSVFVFEKMTVIYESANGIRVAKIHAQADGGVCQIRGAVEGHVDGVAKERLFDRHFIPSH